jgi:pimeloyl-ACP methyl ester carboxylesterase
MIADLESVLAAEAEPPYLLVGHSMGAHTAVAHALQSPQGLAGLVLIGPVYRGVVSDEALEYWDGLAAALEESGTEGFVAYIDGPGLDPDWRSTVLRITRQRIDLHRHPAALAQALREVPRSQPFETMDELEFLDLPALVVASHDVADPGHPFAVAEEYAQRIPGAQLIGEREGESPLAWQGGRLSREIAAFCAEPRVSERLGSPKRTNNLSSDD